MSETGSYILPPTVSRDVLLESGSDRRFRSLVADLFTISARMEIVRERLGRKLGITGPQYSLIVAIARLQASGGVSVGAVAQALHVSSAFVATETGKLVRRRFLAKRTNPLDRRGVEPPDLGVELRLLPRADGRGDACEQQAGQVVQKIVLNAIEAMQDVRAR